VDLRSLHPGRERLDRSHRPHVCGWRLPSAHGLRHLLECRQRALRLIEGLKPNFINKTQIFYHMKNFLSLLISLVVALFFSLAPSGARAADTADNAQILQLTPNGDWVLQTINFNSSSAGQDLTVQSTGLLGVNSVVKGNLGSSVIVSGSAVSLTTATAATITSHSFGVGTWRVYGYVDSVLASATSTTLTTALSTTTNSLTNSLQSQDTSLTAANALTTTSVTLTTATPFLQFTVASGTQTVYLVEQNAFSAGTETAYGTLFWQQVK
jgi:hypothetical protein